MGALLGSTLAQLRPKVDLFGTLVSACAVLKFLFTAFGGACGGRESARGAILESLRCHFATFGNNFRVHNHVCISYLFFVVLVDVP